MKFSAPTDYAPSLRLQLKRWGSDQAIRTEYRRLQAAVDKRLKRAEAAGYGETPYAREMRKITRIKEVDTMANVSRLMSRAYHILNDQRYGLKGIRAGRQKGLNKMIERGMVLEGASRDDLDVLFLVARKRGFLEQYGSQKINELYRTRQQNGKNTNLTARQWWAELARMQSKINKNAQL